MTKAQLGSGVCKKVLSLNVVAKRVQPPFIIPRGLLFLRNCSPVAVSNHQVHHVTGNFILKTFALYINKRKTNLPTLSHMVTTEFKF
jgi:hypothetical protein